MRAFYWIALLGFSFSVDGTVRHVPIEYPTIQAGLDACEGGDTVLVEPGLYIESLVGPGVEFTLLGSVAPENVDSIGPAVFPGPLTRSDTLPCLRLMGGQPAHIARFKWRNDSRMRGNRVSNDVGGIAIQFNQLNIEDCVFDSVAWGVNTRGRLILERCTFRQCTSSCVYARGPSSFISQCTFTGQGYALVSCFDSASVDLCLFSGASQGYFLWAGGNRVLIQNCRFANYSFGFSPVWMQCAFGGRVSQNIFEHNEVGPNCLEIVVPCGEESFPAVVVEDNLFIDNQVGFGQGSSGLYVRCLDLEAEGLLADIRQNTFRDGMSNQGFAKAILSTSYSTIADCRFENLHPPLQLPTIASMSAENEDTLTTVNDTLIVRNCIFETEDWAASASGSIVDARVNWWGDPSGPYHATLNPFGRGGEVSDDVLFVPWIMDTSTSTNDLPAWMRQSFRIGVSPNPFNSEIRIEIAGFTRDDFSLRLFDLQGREISVLHRGPLTGGHLSFTASADLASGVYFVVASDHEFTEARKAVLLK